MQMVTLNKDDIYQGPLVLVNHNYPIANNYQITNCSTAKDSTISLENGYGDANKSITGN